MTLDSIVVSLFNAVHCTGAIDDLRMEVFNEIVLEQLLQVLLHSMTKVYMLACTLLPKYH